MGHTPWKQEASVGDLRRLIITVPQAAHVLALDAAQVRKAIDRHVVTATYIKRGNRRIRALDGVDVFCLRMRDWLKSDVRAQLYLRLKQAPERDSLKQVFHVLIKDSYGSASQAAEAWVYNTATETLTEMASLNDLSRLVDDEGTIRGAGVEAHRIAALVAGGMSVEEILEDYPNLDRAQVEAAVDYARMNPKQGRPYPDRTVKSVLRKGGGGGLAAAFAAARGDDKDED